MGLGERIRVGRVLDVAVERHDRIVGIAERLQRHAVGAPRRQRLLVPHRFRERAVAGERRGKIRRGARRRRTRRRLGRHDRERPRHLVGGDLIGAELPRARVELGQHRRQVLLLHRRAVMAHAAEVRHAPTLHRARDDGDRLLRARHDGGLDCRRIVPVDHFGLPAERSSLPLEMAPILRRCDEIALTERVAVEDRHDVVEALVGDEVHRLPNLALARLAVADDAVDALAEPVEPRRRAEPARDRQALAERSGRRVEERKAQRGIGMAVDRARDVAQRHEIVARHRPPRAVGRDRDAEIGACRIDDRHGMAFRQDEPVGAAVPGLLRIPAHDAVHQHGDDMRERQRRRGMAAAGRRRRLDREPADGDGLGVQDRADVGHGPRSLPKPNASTAREVQGAPENAP